MASKTFRRGGHIPHFKAYTQDREIQPLPLPDQVSIPLVQHMGAPCQPLVQVGDQVITGQKIGEAQGFVSAPVHASITGIVREIGLKSHPGGKPLEAITIERTSDEPFIPQVSRSLETLSPEEILAAIHEAGIVGMGGAGFPTRVKLSPKKRVDTIILNGAECEPFLTADHRCMLEMGSQLLLGLLAAIKAVGAEGAIIGIEDNKPDCIAALEAVAAGYPQIQVIPLKTKYPQGGEKQLIFALTGKSVPPGALPMDVGVVVQNIGTAVAIAQAITRGKPLIERVVTVSGPDVPGRGNYLVPIGTSLAWVLKCCGLESLVGTKVIVGGPMTGVAQGDLEAPVIKTTGGILVFPPTMVRQETAYHDCVRCARCVEQCPMDLYPNNISRFAQAEMYNKLLDWNVLDCIECGLCSYVCPASRPIVQMIKQAKPVAAQLRKKAL